MVVKKAPQPISSLDSVLQLLIAPAMAALMKLSVATPMHRLAPSSTR